MGLPQSGPSRTSVIELPPGHPLLSSEDLNRLIRRQGIGTTILRALLQERVASGINLEQAESEELVTRFLSEKGITDRHERQNYINAEGLSEEDLAWRATLQRRLELHRHRQHGGDVESFYLERKLDLDQVIYSMIRVRDGELAAELHQQIQEGEAEFGSLAMRYSIGQERFSRGIVGPVPLGAAHPDVMHRLRSGEPGQLWDPFFLVDVWLLIRLETRLPAQLDDRLRQQLEQELFERWLDDQMRAILCGEASSPGPQAAQAPV